MTALKEKTGQWVSGEVLSENLGVSRTTVWKQIKNLINEGYKIESSTKKGYRISGPADLLSPDEVCPALATRVFGRTGYFYYQETDSTNTRARILASQGHPEGTVVVAEKQTAGRGRRGRNWFSPYSQGIYFTIILRPVMPLKDISRLSLVNAVAVAETLEQELNTCASIKWPNDVLIGNKKICGILSEAVTDVDSIEYVVTGIGINISNNIEDFPQDLRTPATSAVQYNRSISRVKIFQSLLLNYEKHYYQLLNGNFACTLQKARAMSTVIGQEVELETVNGLITGVAMDIDDSGFLMVRDRSGTLHTVMSGEINILSSSSQSE